MRRALLIPLVVVICGAVANNTATIISVGGSPGIVVGPVIDAIPAGMGSGNKATVLVLPR